MHLEAINHIPSDPWIYFFKDKKWIILYIGKAKNLKKRVAQYFSPNSLWKQDMLSKADNIDFLIVKNESEALYLEDNLIKKNKPEYNNLLKADNSYAYIKITNDDFPQIFLTRKKFNDWSTYIGPKHNTIHLKKFLQYLRQILQFRGCKNTQFKQWKLCSDYYFWLCKWRCVLPVALSKAKGTADYKKLIDVIISFFKGNTHPIQYEIKSQIDKAIKQENYERAGKLRDIYLHIDELAEQQTVVIQKPITGYLYKTKSFWKFRLYCVCNFYEGKLIDVIRGKEYIQDMDEDELQKSIEREFTPNIQTKKITKSDRKNIDALMERFFDSYVISSSFENELGSEGNINNDILSQLQSRYHLKNFPYRIECIDISHLSGWRSSGGLSCFVEGLRNPKGYRRYKIQHKTVDDYAALQEVIDRRIKTWKLPDLLVLDWGKWQLGIIKNMPELLSQIDIISLWKWEARKKSNIWKTTKKSDKVSEKIYYFDGKQNIQHKDLMYDEVDKFLLKARDEAHRFANAYRKKQMSKEFSPDKSKKH